MAHMTYATRISKRLMPQLVSKGVFFILLSCNLQLHKQSKLAKHWIDVSACSVTCLLKTPTITITCIRNSTHNPLLTCWLHPMVKPVFN